ncbi:hypothetical protein EDB86DRAFT_3085432 [Lactarius hatsudake]|nr:hypothetical protein EDB86DRAFT_3085432 [Lactarius hatsudake]
MLLLSASDLHSLDLTKIPPTGYIPPEMMVTFLATLPRLETFIIGFQLATRRPNQIRRPPVMRTVLCALTSIQFQGASKYLEDLVAQIDVPQLGRMCIIYFNQLMEFQIAQLSKFINRSFGPEFTLLKHTQVTFFSNHVTFHVGRYSTDILCKGVDWQVSHMAQVLSHSSVTLSTVVHLRLKVHLPEDRLLEGTEDVEWLRLLHQFSTMKTLHVSQELAGHIALALEDLTGEMVMDALPSLNLICLEGQPATSIKEFLSMRQLSGCPVTIADTEAEFYERLVSFVDE